MSADNSHRAKRLKDLICSAQMFDSETLAEERELMETKWFDYRFISPTKATRLFIRAYQDTFRRHFEAEVDRERKSNVNGVNRQTYQNNARVRTQIWKARQRADEVGMPYDVYIEVAFDFALRRDRKAFPQPNQLHFPGDANEWWEEYRQEKWDKVLDDGLFRVTHPAYRIENYRGLPAQDAYRAFVIEWARSSDQFLHSCIRRFSYERCQVPAELFRDAITPEVFTREMESVKSELVHIPVEVEPLPDIYDHDLWPSCFGSPHAMEIATPQCSTCPLSEACGRVARGVITKVVERSGSADPHADRKRQQARVRKQRQRQRERLVAGIASQ